MRVERLGRFQLLGKSGIERADAQGAIGQGCHEPTAAGTDAEVKESGLGQEESD